MAVERMDVLIFSDSHGHGSRMQEALDRQISRPNAVFFAGDGLRDVDAVDFGSVDLYAVQGNCDWFSATAVRTELVTALGGHTILLTHGHMYGVKGGYGALLSHAAKVGADIVLFGHTHLPYLETIPQGSEIGGVILTRPLYLFNPGSIGMDGSFGTLVLRGENVLFSHGQL